MKQYYRNEIRKIHEENEEDYDYILPDDNNFVMHYNITEVSLEMKHLAIGNIKGATLDKIVEWIGGQKSLEIRDLVMITHENYTTSIDFLLKLIKRFMIPWPVGMSIKETSEMLKERYKIIQNKILGFFQHWITNRYKDFSKYKKLRVLFDTWIEYIKEKTQFYKLNGRQIDGQIYAILKRSDEITNYRNIFTLGPSSSPQLISIPINIIPYDQLVYGSGLVNYSSELIATQLALIDQKLFCKLSPKDFMAKKSKEDTQYKPMELLMERYNLFSSFVAAYILKEVSQTAREALLDKFFDITSKCMQLNNVNCASMIYVALSTYFPASSKNSSKATIKWKSYMDSLQKTFLSDDNYKNTREYIRSLEIPCVPCFQLWKKDMDTISEFFKEDYLDKDKGMINIPRQFSIANQMKELEMYQKAKYDFFKFPQLYNFLESDYKSSLALVVEPSKFLDPSALLEISKKYDTINNSKYDASAVQSQ